MKRLLTILGIILLAFLIWFAGPYIGLEAVEIRLYAIVGLVVIVLAIAVFRILNASRAASFMENLIKRQDCYTFSPS